MTIILILVAVVLLSPYCLTNPALHQHEDLRIKPATECLFCQGAACENETIFTLQFCPRRPPSACAIWTHGQRGCIAENECTNHKSTATDGLLITNKSKRETSSLVDCKRAPNPKRCMRIKRRRQNVRTGSGKATKKPRIPILIAPIHHRVHWQKDKYQYCCHENLCNIRVNDSERPPLIVMISVGAAFTLVFATGIILSCYGLYSAFSHSIANLRDGRKDSTTTQG